MRIAVVIVAVIALGASACGGGTSTPTATTTAAASATQRPASTPRATGTAAASPNPTGLATSSPAPTSTPAPAGKTGVAGTVTIGPSCPVQQVESPCPDRPYEATLTFWVGSSRIAETRSGADGRFFIELAPGTYRLVGESPSTLPHVVEQEVTVEPGQITMVAVQYDSGIR